MKENYKTISLTKMKNFKFHGKFSNTDIQRFPNGWILRNDLVNCVKQSVVPGHQSNLIGKLIFVDPGIWGDDALRSEYWKEKTYHPSLSKMKICDVKKNVVFIGKIIKKKASSKKRRKDIYETLLMINSAQQFNEFDDEQCRKMININGSISKMNKFTNKKNGHISHTTDSVHKTVLRKVVGSETESETESVVSAVVLDKAKRGKKTTTKKAHEIPERNIPQIDKHDKEQTGPKCLQNNNICEKTKDKYENNSGNAKHDDKLNTVIKKNTKSRKKRKVDNSSDFILQQVVAFDYQDSSFLNRFKSEMANAEVPNRSLINSRYLIGHVFERIAKKKVHNTLPIKSHLNIPVFKPSLNVWI